MPKTPVKGRGAQINISNPFEKLQYTPDDSHENRDSEMRPASKTQFFIETPKQIVSVSNSPDLGLMHSINPYQGCEHGCTYCYARNSHNYWGFGSGLDFESKIVVKLRAPKMLDAYLSKFQGKVTPIFLSGNTDCYQPAERKYRLTRKLLEILYRYRYPATIITKNRLLLRDLDLLEKLAAENLVNVFISITTLNESVRNKMEPRTASAEKRLQVIETLSAHGVPVGVMNAPVIPGLTDHEIPNILKETASRGALAARYTVVRLNGTIAVLFEDWLQKSFPAQASKVLNQIAACHEGSLNDSQWHRRQKGSGSMAAMIAQMFKTALAKYYRERHLPPLDKSRFRRGGNLLLDL